MTEPSESPATETSVPARGNRYFLFDDGQGDVRIFQIAPGGDFPRGTLVPIPEVPGFLSKALAVQYLNANAERFKGMQLMVLKGLEIFAPKISTSVEMCRKQRNLASDTK